MAIEIPAGSTQIDPFLNQNIQKVPREIARRARDTSRQYLAWVIKGTHLRHNLPESPSQCTLHRSLKWMKCRQRCLLPCSHLHVAPTIPLVEEDPPSWLHQLGLVRRTSTPNFVVILQFGALSITPGTPTSFLRQVNFDTEWTLGIRCVPIVPSVAYIMPIT